MIKHIYIIAGEASGDFLASQLMAELKSRQDDIIFSGIGGNLMEEQGLKSLFPMSELSLMGIFEILPKLKKLMGRINQTVDDVIDKKPDIVLTIDAPDFSFRVQKKIRKMLGDDAPQLVHYVAPTVWAWRPKRAKKIAEFLDAMICLFHFEPPYFEKEGLRAIAVGHPMMESGINTAKSLLPNDRQYLGLFFGSRKGEVKRLAPTIIKAAKEIIRVKPEIEIVVPTLPYLKNDLNDLLKSLPVKKHIFSGAESKWSVFKSCDAAVAVSGTVGLELAACGIPHVIAYKVNALTALMARMLIKTNFAHLANIILNKEVVPEFIQKNCKPDLIAKETIKLLDDNQSKIAQQNAFNDVRIHIMGKNNEQPSKTAASFILSL